MLFIYRFQKIRATGAFQFCDRAQNKLQKIFGQFYINI